LFADMPNPFAATRYHSLVIQRDTVPDCLEVTAETDEGEIMGVRHRHYPIWGVQFHPESILTQNGRQILKNFLGLK
jgi:anthranilate/para-aminobenzoate synthase component II